MAENEKFTVSGSQIVEKVKQLIHEGNIRRVRLIHDGKVSENTRKLSLDEMIFHQHISKLI